MWLRLLVLFGIAVLVAFPFWRVTKKPTKRDTNFYESGLGHQTNNDNNGGHHTGGDAGGHH